MRLLKILTSLLLLPLFGIAQIPNSSFENWTNLIPDGWLVNISPPLLLPVSSSNDARTGSYAIKGEIVDDFGLAFGPYIKPVTSGLGFPVSQNDTAFYGFYKADLIGSNLGLVEVQVYDSLYNQIGAGITYLTSDTNYSEFYVPIIYSSGATAKEMSVIFQMTDTDSTVSFNVGSYFIIDDLSFEHTTTVGLSAIEKSFYAVSPNPANDHIIIRTANSSSRNQYINIYDASGKKLLSNNMVAFRNELFLDVSLIPAGFYILAITDGEHSHSQKILISR
jgi:hypothetical protein